MRFTIPDSLWAALSAHREERQRQRRDAILPDMDTLQDQVEADHDAVLLDPGMGPMTYITRDGRVLLDMRTWDGDSIVEATDDEAIAALLAGAEKTPVVALLDLLPERPPDAHECPMCSGTRYFAFRELQLLCMLCSGRGWATLDAIARAEAKGTWPLREAPSRG
jgi:hypothetical protein